jgi:hypothetical protein
MLVDACLLRVTCLIDGELEKGRFCPILGRDAVVTDGEFEEEDAVAVAFADESWEASTNSLSTTGMSFCSEGLSQM